MRPDAAKLLRKISSMRSESQGVIVESLVIAAAAQEGLI
jgi:hypothetical protein